MTRNTVPRGSARDSRRKGARLDVDGILTNGDTHIIVCCGSGGVGKTTSSAALGVRAAEHGRNVCVVTIDPARRLAQSMGLHELDNVPRPVAGVDDSRGGSLDAMMLDMKRTFDEVVEAHATAEKAQQILANPFYIALSSSFAGTQEYMAMEKLGQLYSQAGPGSGSEARWDLIIVDTPPSRSALDFLDAPERLSSLLDGRFIRLLLSPAKGPARMFSAGFGVVTSTLNRVLGAQILKDVQTFIAAFDTLFGGFRQRAEATYGLLQDPSTAFVVVASPEADPMREASYFVERLTAEKMPLVGMIVNRVNEPVTRLVSRADAESVGQRLEGGAPNEQLVSDLLSVHAEQWRTHEREHRVIERFVAAHPAISQVRVPALADDVHDLDGLRHVAELLTMTE